jgi:hypothetical protein
MVRALPETKQLCMAVVAYQPWYPCSMAALEISRPPLEGVPAGEA